MCSATQGLGIDEGGNGRQRGGRREEEGDDGRE